MMFTKTLFGTLTIPSIMDEEKPCLRGIFKKQTSHPPPSRCLLIRHTPSFNVATSFKTGTGKGDKTHKRESFTSSSSLHVGNLYRPSVLIRSRVSHLFLYHFAYSLRVWVYSLIGWFGLYGYKKIIVWPIGLKEFFTSPEIIWCGLPPLPKSFYKSFFWYFSPSTFWSYKYRRCVL